MEKGISLQMDKVLSQSHPYLCLSPFVLGEHVFALSRQMCGVIAATGQELPYLWTTGDGWIVKHYLTFFHNPARQKSPAEILRLSTKTTCFGSKLHLCYLSFMTLI